jgi:hypothetical protein
MRVGITDAQKVIVTLLWFLDLHISTQPLYGY